MQYIISDIHGCRAQFHALLEKIPLRPEDTLYVLGDAMDRGPEPIRVIRDIMAMDNAVYILGNHDRMMLTVLDRLLVELTEESAAKLSPDDLQVYFNWMQNGGGVTLQQFRKLPPSQQEEIREYLRCAELYTTIEHDGKLYVLVHAGILGFDPNKELDEYEPEAFLWDRPDYSSPLFPGNRIFLVTGHTPTPLIRRDRAPKIYAEHNHIAIDCGCVFGGNLAAYCIETGEAFYAG